MWDKIVISALLVAGAFAFLISITVILFIMERKDSARRFRRVRFTRYQKSNKAA